MLTPHNCWTKYNPPPEQIIFKYKRGGGNTLKKNPIINLNKETGDDCLLKSYLHIIWSY